MAPNRAKFARLLAGAVNAIAAFEGKSTRAVAQELGEQINRSHSTIENYKSEKALPTDPRQVRTLALACMQRAYLNETWLREFLASVDYPDSAGLLHAGANAIRAGGMQQPPADASHWRDNLAAAPYARFVMRNEPLHELAECLRAQQAVAIVGFGGTGKTSLAYYLAVRCKEQATGKRSGNHRLTTALPAIDAVIWISDKEHPGATTLERSCETIARTLGYEGLSAAEPARRQQAVEQLLRSRTALIICDNVESMTDGRIVPWLLSLPAPTRIVLTTRTRPPAFSDTALHLMELGGLTETEALRLSRERAAQIGLRDEPTPAEQQQLYLLTGGNPLAIRQVLGYLKRTGQNLTAGLAAFQAIEGDLLATLFAATWPHLYAPARALLAALTLFQSGADRAALLQTTGLDPHACDQALGQLTDYALLDVGTTATDRRPRYRLHSLTRRFLITQPEGLPEGLHERWLQWATEYAGRFGYLLNDIAQLGTLDADEPTLFAALEWAAQQLHDRATIALATGLEFYYYVRGWWSRKSDLHRHYIAAALRLGDQQAQVNALTMHIQLLCRLNQPQAAAPFLAQLEAIPGVEQLTGPAAFQRYHAQALYALATDAAATAAVAWTHILAHATAWALPDHMQIGAEHWLGVCAWRSGRLDTAAGAFTRSLEAAETAGYARWIARNQLHLARIARARGDLPDLQQRLSIAAAHTQPTDREQLAHLYREQAWLARLQGNPVQAQLHYRSARDLFIRMGLDHELHPADEQALISMHLGV